MHLKINISEIHCLLPHYPDLKQGGRNMPLQTIASNISMRCSLFTEAKTLLHWAGIPIDKQSLCGGLEKISDEPAAVLTMRKDWSFCRATVCFKHHLLPHQAFSLCVVQESICTSARHLSASTRCKRSKAATWKNWKWSHVKKRVS